MKRKIFSILFALVLVLGFSLMAVPAGAIGAVPDRVTAITNAADRLVSLQNTDGGFDWKPDGNPASGSTTNTLGITAIGILEGWKLDAKPAYETALAKAYKYCVDKPPTYTWDAGNSKYKETVAGVDSFPDATFLVWLSQAAASDVDLLAEINTLQDPDITAADIATLARTRWDNRVLYLGSTQETPLDGTATGLAQYIRDARHAGNLDALIPWDLELGVKAAQVLDGYYSGQGYDQQARDIAEVIYDSVDDDYGSCLYFDSTDTSQDDYIAGLTGAIEAFREIDSYSVKVDELVSLLLDEQQSGGYWNYYGATPATMSVQSTAYAVMALQDYSAEVVTATWKAADWLASSQRGDGGWFAEGGVGIEYLEVDSEAAWALARLPAPVTIDSKGYYSIQSAINAASPDDTINVAAGTYNEEITIGKANLTLQSESALGAIIRPLTTPANHGAAIYISADGVTVDGFEIDGTTVCKNGIYGWETSGLTIRNNKIHGAVNAWDGCGILLISWGNAGTVYDNLIENNEVYDTGRMGIMVMDHGSNYTVTSGNTITRNIVHDVWTVTWGDHGGGIQINVAKNCSITKNEVYNVQNGQRGIYMFGSATGNIISQNTIRDNPTGIQLWISGEGGTTIDWGADTPASPQVRFNNIYNNGSGAISTNIAGISMVMDATNNWWGANDGPSDGAGVTDPVTGEPADGGGDKVSTNVHFDPWLGAQVSASKTETKTDGTVDAKGEADTEVVVNGTATVTVARYSSNPGTSFGGDTGKYIDVHIDSTAGVNEIEIRLYYTSAEIAGKAEATLKLRWWDGTSWVVCSDSGVTYPAGGPTYRGYMWAKIRNVPVPTVPSLDDLTGTPFGGSGATPLAGGGGPPSTLSKVGSVSLLQYIDWQGRTRIKIILRSDDGVLTIIIFSATLVHNAGGNPLENMGIVTLATPPPPPGYVLVGHAYDCLPGGANFAPKVTMTFAYDPADIPDGVNENDMLMAYWDGGKWINLPTAINAAANTATAGVEHFTPFALMAYSGLASFKASNLSIQPLEVQPEETVTITLSVANTGDTEGNYSVVLKINGAKEAEKSITVAAGSSESVAFSVTREEAGSYSVAVDGLTGSFTVVAPAPAPPPAPPAPPEAKPPINWMWIGIIAAAVVVGLIIFFAVRRRAY